MKIALINVRYVIMMVTLPALFAANAESGRERAELIDRTTLTHTQLMADIRYLCQVLDEVHPNISYRVSDTEIKTRKAVLERALRESTTRDTFASMLDSFIKSFADGHTQVIPSSSTIPKSNVGETPRSKWNLRMIDDNIAHIQFNGMDSRSRGEWRRFLESTFLTIKTINAKGVIVDIRFNGGGDSSLGDDLLDYVTALPYRLASRKEWRFSDRYIQSDEFREAFVSMFSPDVERMLAANAMPNAFHSQNPPLEVKRRLRSCPTWAQQYFAKYAPHWLDESYGAPVSEIIAFGEIGLRVPPQEFPLRFVGPVCFLVSKGTFSSAIMLANAVEDYELAMIIGEETQPANQFGEVFYFSLPNSGLKCMVPSAQFVRANGDARSIRGVLPKILAPLGSQNANGRDLPVEAAVSWIRKTAGKVSVPP